MITLLKKSYYAFGAALTVGMIAGASGEAFAQTSSTGSTSGNTFSTISQNITTSIQDLPGLITGTSYLIGTALGVLGIMKIRDHVENPTQTKLKDGAVRLGAGGALFALPILFEAMFQTIDAGSGSQGASTAALNKVEFSLK